MIESFSINSYNGTLRYKCVGVDIFNQSEDDGRLPFFGKHKHHFHFSACVEAGCIDDRHSTVRVFVDVSSYLLIFIGYDKELDCRVLFIALVDSKATNIKSYKPVTTFSRSFNTK